MRAAIGAPGESHSTLIERGSITRFADAIGDGSPRYRGDAPIAPPTFLRSVGLAIPTLPDADRVPRVLDAGSEWTYGAAVKAGDRITYTTQLESLAEREGRLGAMVFATYLTEYINQEGEVVATQRNTVIRMPEAS